MFHYVGSIREGIHYVIFISLPYFPSSPLLADIAGGQVYPVTGERYAEISRRLTADDDTLWQVDVALEAAAGDRAPGA